MLVPDHSVYSFPCSLLPIFPYINLFLGLQVPSSLYFQYYKFHIFPVLCVQFPNSPVPWYIYIPVFTSPSSRNSLLLNPYISSLLCTRIPMKLIPCVPSFLCNQCLFLSCIPSFPVPFIYSSLFFWFHVFRIFPLFRVPSSLCSQFLISQLLVFCIFPFPLKPYFPMFPVPRSPSYPIFLVSYVSTSL